MVAAPRLLLGGSATVDTERRRAWRHLYAGGPPTPRQRHLTELRHHRDVVDDAIALERALAWRRTRDRLAAVGIRL
jgi:hypothetical protein